MPQNHFHIDTALVKALIQTQFPQWKNLPIYPVKPSGWDNKTFRLGDNMLVRLPSATDYKLQIEKEHHWLPKLSPNLPLEIPVPLAKGKPGCGYPCKWSIYRWIKGKSAATSHIQDMDDLAHDLASFLLALQKINVSKGPEAGPHSFYRGGPLKVYDGDTQKALKILEGKIDIKKAEHLWKSTIATLWSRNPVWVHGDVSAGNLLLQDGKLHAVIDFGQLAVGDPACDLAIAWTMFKKESRDIFQKTLKLDLDTWNRGKGWALWKSLIVAAGLTNPNNTESKQCRNIIDEILLDYKMR